MVLDDCRIQASRTLEFDQQRHASGVFRTEPGQGLTGAGAERVLVLSDIGASKIRVRFL